MCSLGVAFTSDLNNERKILRAWHKDTSRNVLNNMWMVASTLGNGANEDSGGHILASTSRPLELQF